MSHSPPWEGHHDNTIKRDGETLAVVADENAAFAWLLRHQGQSVDWALKHEGYSIENNES